MGQTTNKGYTETPRTGQSRHFPNPSKKSVFDKEVGKKKEPHSTNTPIKRLTRLVRAAKPKEIPATPSKIGMKSLARGQRSA
jgi:hypothetical protein